MMKISLDIYLPSVGLHLLQYTLVPTITASDFVIDTLQVLQVK